MFIDRHFHDLKLSGNDFDLEQREEEIHNIKNHLYNFHSGYWVKSRTVMSELRSDWLHFAPGV